MSRKIVFFDIDGTILNENKEILDSTREAIRQLQQQGIYTAIATGRTPVHFEEIRQELNIQSYVALNGQYAVFEGEVIYDNPIDKEQLELLRSAMKGSDHAFVYVNHEHIRSSIQDHDYIYQAFKCLKYDYPETDNLFHRHSPVYQGVLLCDETARTAYIDKFPQFTFLSWHTYAADVLPFGASKAVGIQKMIEFGDFDLGHSYAFGDGNNDVEMLSYVGTGVAMGNAVPETKESADLITTSCEDDGIWNGLVELGLLQSDAVSSGSR